MSQRGRGGKESRRVEVSIDEEQGVFMISVAAELADIPLFYQPKIAISRPDLCGLEMDISSRRQWFLARPESRHHARPKHKNTQHHAQAQGEQLPGERKAQQG